MMNRTSLPLCDFRGCDVTVMGLGRFGGGVGAVQFLIERGAAVTITDVLPGTELEDALTQIDVAALRALHLGGHCEEDFRDTDLIVVSPAVRRDNRFLDIARRECVPLTSEMNLFWQFQRGRTVGVTGSNGKSTTAAIIHSLLQAGGMTSRLGGNIGKSLLPCVDDIQPDDWSVLELSSFQLADLDRLPASPDVAVVTNFSPNHLDRHESLADYRRAKQTILRWQTPEGIAVLNGNDPDVADWPVHGQKLTFGDKRLLADKASRGVNPPGSPDGIDAGVFRDGDDVVIRTKSEEKTLSLSGLLMLPGDHNRDNAIAAICAASAIGVSSDAIRSGLRDFQPLPHRLQWVAEIDGRKFYNDSLATTPQSVRAALDSFCEPVVLLAGGYDKQIDLTELARTICGGVKAVALMGQTAEVLQLLIDPDGVADPPATRECESFEEAFRWACNRSSPGDVVLLSPGCASYDWFRNFAERGERFIELVKQLEETGGLTPAARAVYRK